MNFQLVTSSFQHIPFRIKDMEQPGSSREKRGLRSKGNKYRQTSFVCNTCKVPLCTHPYGCRKDASSCFKLWHDTGDLLGEHRRRSNNRVERAKPLKRKSGEALDEEDLEEEESNEEDELSDGCSTGSAGDERVPNLPAMDLASPLDLDRMQGDEGVDGDHHHVNNHERGQQGVEEV